MKQNSHQRSEAYSHVSVIMLKLRLPARLPDQTQATEDSTYLAGNVVKAARVLNSAALIDLHMKVAMMELSDNTSHWNRIIAVVGRAG